MNWFIRIIAFALLLCTVSSCSSNERSILEIPVEFRGKWVDEFNEFEMIINANRIAVVEIAEKDTNHNNISGLVKTGRANCNRCLPYGLKIIYDSSIGEEQIIYLDEYDPTLKKFLKLTLIGSAKNPHSGNRVYFDEEFWLRNDLDDPG